MQSELSHEGCSREPPLGLVLARLLDDSLDAGEDLVNVAARRVRDRDAHVADTEVLGRNVLVQAAGNDDVALRELGDDVGGGDALRVADRAHAVRGDVAVQGHEAAAELLELVLDVLRDLPVLGETLLERELALGDLLEALAERVDELDGCCKLAKLATKLAKLATKLRLKTYGSRST